MESLARQIAQQYFSLNASAQQMAGYGSLNFKLKVDGKAQYVLKLDASEETADFLHAENAVLQYLSTQADQPGLLPVPQSNRQGSQLFTYQEDQQSYMTRMLSFIPGTFSAEVAHDEKMLKSLGQFLAKLDSLLLPLRPAAVERRRFEWDLQYCLDTEIHLPHIKDVKRTRIAAYFFDQYRQNILPQMPHLRKSLIHNDANDWNVLTQEGKVSGLIDFGDMAYTATIHELAVALAYACMHTDDPLQTVIWVCEAYHEVFPLEEREIEVLYYLIAARLCTSVCMSAYSRHLYPENDYIAISEAPAWDLLESWIQLNPYQFIRQLKLSCGFSVPASPNASLMQEERQQHLSQALSLSYPSPLILEGGALQYLYDSRGQTYLDAYNNVIHLGHCHPRVVQAGQKQMAKLNTNTRYLYSLLNEYATALSAKFPDPLNYVYFVNSGSAAADLAIRLAQAYQQRQQLIVMQHGYHGNTQIGIDISSYKYNGKGGQGAPKHVQELPLYDTYRSQGSVADYLKQCEQMLERLDAPAAFVAESIVGCGGQIPIPADYLQGIYALIRAKGGLCIADEVQTGFGRLGTHFWGFESQGVIPDIVILGKPMGNGHPIGAVVTTAPVVEAFENGMEFFSSFGGNPVSCAIGLEVLKVIEEENLMTEAQKTGDYFGEQMRKLAAQYPVLGDVRGSGLFWGLEFVADGQSKKPHPQLAADLVAQLKEEGILLGTDGPFHNVVKFKPPMCFHTDNVDQLVTKMADLLSKASK
ncbi:MAG: aminotransferase class III-fold pyridoxal phosphate-dependent enzyme [Bacteroidota bacterium]